MGIFNNVGGKGLAALREGIGSVIGENARMKGEFSTTGSVNINGEFEGSIKANGEVVVSPGGKVTGEVEGNSIIISGKVDGNIRAKETLEIAKTGKVNGDLAGARIVIEEGSSYHGRVTVEAAGALETAQQNS
jgi:cytoskeletal protein CcmA (bactofilin family)